MLSPRSHRIIEAFAEAALDVPGGKFTHSVSQVKLAERVDQQLAIVSRDSRYLFLFILYSLEWLSPLYRLNGHRFTRMSLEMRARLVESWRGAHWSVRRMVRRYLEAIIISNYYAIPAVAAQCGYTPKFQPPRPAPVLPADKVEYAPEGDRNEVVDVCIVGSGAGGAVAAHTLAKMGYNVLILEEGGSYTTKDYSADVMATMRKMYRYAGMVHTVGYPAVLTPVGRCVGGTTEINSGTCFRTPDKIFDQWVRKYGLANWTPDRMRSHFEEVEQMLHVAPASSEVLGPNSRLFAEGARKLGLTAKPLVRNAPDCKGSGVCVFGCPTNAKQSMALTYIPAALEAGARLYAGTQVSHVEFRHGHATGVVAHFCDPETGKRRGKLTVEAKIVILACGTFHTPVVLRRSRVPDPSHLIGRHLTLHPATKALAMFPDEVKGWNEIPQGMVVEDLAAEGIVFEGIFLPPAFTASSFLLNGPSHREVMERYNHLACFGLMVSDTSSGRILRMPNGHALAMYNLNKTDVQRFVRGIGMLAEIFFAAGATKVFPGLHNLPVLTREEGAAPIYAAKIHAKDLELQAFHPLGSCRMGADPHESVIDPHCRFYGFDNLYITDGSVFPTSLGVNPQMTIMAAAHKIAGYIGRECL